MDAIPQYVSELVAILTSMRGTVAVVLGGSRAVRSDDKKVDVILRDLDVVEYCHLV